MFESEIKYWLFWRTQVIALNGETLKMLLIIHLVLAYANIDTSAVMYYSMYYCKI